MRALSGIQPSGKLHVGNYFGMMKPALELQEKGEAFLFIANYHALTSVNEAKVLRAGVRDVALDFLACGLDPERTVFYRQSDVPEVHELAWLLSIVTPLGLLERCHSYKDKVAKGVPANHGLFAYPVLMAADILAVQADVVPVGQDQKQHVEVTRDIAIKFNQKFGETFKVPAPMILASVAVVPGLDGQKMSKSYNNTIELFASQADTRKAIMRIVTDSKTVAEPKDPATCNVFALYKLFATAQEREAMAAHYRVGGLGYGEVKQALFDKFWTAFEPFRRRREELQKEPARVEQILQRGAARAREELCKTLKAARQAVGLE
ncbi:MAG: tryptophan--tRNA ligase [Verrucomicrobia bacterium]|nr:tryptophan--tRNA ligase [Verrucomicrobiota bacterium]MBU1735178.1 tryptophan--tRNA ligase [Verrucomicrobiota bacterium]MBU1855961.1 tryptophan--tRNA ligase [Verrucomicrobiota bacterium]